MECFANAWFDGKDDPNVSILRIAPEDVYYWDTKLVNSFLYCHLLLRLLLVIKPITVMDGRRTNFNLEALYINRSPQFIAGFLPFN